MNNDLETEPTLFDELERLRDDVKTVNDRLPDELNLNESKREIGDTLECVATIDETRRTPLTANDGDEADDGENCPVCGDPIPENSRKKLNLGIPEYCSIGCRLEAESE